MKRQSMMRLARLVCLVLIGALVWACSAAQDLPPLPYSPAPGPDGFGQRCTKTEDCASSLCVRVDSAGGVCTRPCASNADCPGASNWACVQPGDLAHPVCACRPHPERGACDDGTDNDCDGVVDVCLTCGGVRVPANDPANCGSCGHACPAGAACVAGACRCSDPARADVCGGACTSLASDAANCGSCGHACPAAEACVNGACACPAAAPALCGSSCVDTRTDGRNCGSCGTVCPASEACVNGACACPAATPDLCSGQCVDTQTSRSSCGACGNACGGAETCVAGKCTCPPSAPTACSGACVDTQSDWRNCGACNNVCGAVQSCLSGVCTCKQSGQAACGPACVTLATDPGNCGACGQACGSGETCSAGVCGCPSGVVCGGICESVNDSSNCGACGAACAQGQLCSAGKCTCTGAGLTTCGASCVNTQTDAANCGACAHACPAGEVCSGGQCGCAAGQTYCAASRSCEDLQSDAANCGACGNACPSGMACRGGACACAGAGLTLCGSACVDLQGDGANCGVCGMTCGGGVACRAGACQCPAPTLGAASRVTPTAGDAADGPAMAWSGSQVAVLFTATPAGAATGSNVRLALLHADGSRAGAGDVALTAFAAGGPSTAVAGDVAWTGKGWGVVWAQTWTRPGAGSPTTDLMFQQLAADGTPQGTPADVTALTPGPAASTKWPRLAYSAGTFALASALPSGGASFQILGADGAHPLAIASVPLTSGGGAGHQDIAAAPGGGFGVLATDGVRAVFQAFKVDGSRAAPQVPVASGGPSSVAALAYDGASWVAAWVQVTRSGTNGQASLIVARGPSFATRQDVDTVRTALPVLGAARLLVSGSDVAVVWDAEGVAKVARYRALPDASARLVPLTPATRLGAGASAVVGSAAAVITGPGSLLAGWTDTSTGHHEIDAEPVTFTACQ